MNDKNKKANKPLSETSILDRVGPILVSAQEDSEELVAQKRVRGHELYNRRPFEGDEALASNRHVVGDARQSVNWMRASLLRLFESRNRVVEFLPHGAEDQALAEQQTEVVNYIVREANSHAGYLDNCISEGLISGLGILTADWEIDGGWTVPAIIQVTDDQLPALVQAEEAGTLRIIEVGEPAMMPPPSPELPPIVSRAVKVRHSRKNAKIVIKSVPVDRFIVSKDATFDELSGGICADLQGYWRVLPRFKLIEMGFDAKKVASIPSASEDTSTMADERNRDVDGDDGTSDVHDEVRVYEVFVRMDADGDGYTELVRLTIGGDPGGKAILLNTQEVSLAPFAAFVPGRKPNTLFGDGLPAMIEPEIKLASQAKRAVIDNLHLSNHPTRVVDPEQVNIDDLLNPNSRTIRGNPAGISYITPPFVAGQSFPFVTMLEETMEMATGVGRNLMAVNGVDMQNETATAANMRSNASQLLIEYTARMFAETGYKYLIRIVTSLLVDRPDEANAMTVRLRGQAVPLTTDGWNVDLDIKSNVLFGVTDRNGQAAALQMLYAQQQQVIAAGRPWVDDTHVYQTLSLMAENAGYQNPGRFFADPASIPPQPPAPPPPDPKMIEVQMKQEAQAAELAMKQEDRNFDREIRTAESREKMALARWEAEQRIALRVEELKAEAIIAAASNPTQTNVRFPE